MQLTLEQIQRLTPAELDSVSSETYRQTLEGQNGAAFSAKIDSFTPSRYVEQGGITADTPAQPAQPAAPATLREAMMEEVIPEETPAVTVEETAVQKDELGNTLITEGKHTGKFKYSYTPIDKAGKPIGSPQVFYYTDQKDLLAQITQGHMNMMRVFREQQLQNKIDSATAGLDPALRNWKPPVILQPRSLTADESYTVQKMRDEGRIQEAAAYEQKILLGGTPAEIAASQNALTESAFKNAVMAALSSFITSTPTYCRTNNNSQRIVAFVHQQKLNPADPRSYSLAYETLKEYMETEVPATDVSNAVSNADEQPVQAAQSAVPPAIQPATYRMPSTGLTRSDAPDYRTSAAPRAPGRPGQKQVIKLADITIEWIERLPSEQYKKLLQTNPGFANRVDQLYAERSARVGRR